VDVAGGESCLVSEVDVAELSRYEQLNEVRAIFVRSAGRVPKRHQRLASNLTQIGSFLAYCSCTTGFAKAPPQPSALLSSCIFPLIKIQLFD
jgi:hypothetical protein